MPEDGLASSGPHIDNCSHSGLGVLVGNKSLAVSLLSWRTAGTFF